jgi:hypothetical protein
MSFDHPIKFCASLFSEILSARPITNKPVVGKPIPLAEISNILFRFRSNILLVSTLFNQSTRTAESGNHGSLQPWRQAREAKGQLKGAGLGAVSWFGSRTNVHSNWWPRGAGEA